jgi:tetratricopeptide (TPR) repeat protein
MSGNRIKEEHIIALLDSVPEAIRDNRLKSVAQMQRIITAGQRMHRPEWEEAGYRLMGDFYRQKCEFDKAITGYNLALAISSDYRSNDETAKCWNGIGSCHWFMGNSDLALEAYIHTVQLLEHTENLEAKAMSVSNLGVAYASRKEFDQAMNYFEQGLQLRQQIGSISGVASSLLNMGGVFEDLGDYEEALIHFEQGIEAYTVCNNQRHLTYAYTMIGSLLRKMQRLSESIGYFEKARDTAQEQNDRFGVAQACHCLAELHFETGDEKAAFADLKLCTRLAKRIKAREVERDASKLYARIYEEKHRYRLALQYFKRSTDLLVELNDEEAKKRVSEIRVRFESERKQQEAEIYRLKNIELVAKQEEIEAQQNALAEANDRLQEKNDELEKSYEALQKAQNEVIELERVQSIIAMAVTANHELNQPLMIISGNLDLLGMSLEADPDPLRSHYMKRSKEALERIRNILNTMSNIERISFADYSEATPMVVIEKHGK